VEATIPLRIRGWVGSILIFYWLCRFICLGRPHFHAVTVYCHHNVCLSVCLSVTKCILAKRYIVQSKSVDKWIGNTPHKLSTPTVTYPPHLPTTKFRNFTYYISLSWSRDHFLCRYEDARVLLSRWSLINATYAVRSTVSARAGLLVLPLYDEPRFSCSRFTVAKSVETKGRCLMLF